MVTRYTFKIPKSIMFLHIYIYTYIYICTTNRKKVFLNAIYSSTQKKQVSRNKSYKRCVSAVQKQKVKLYLESFKKT